MIGSKISLVYPYLKTTEDDGIEYLDTFWEDLRVPVNAVRVGSVSPPDWEQFKDDGAGSTGVFAYNFDASAIEQVYFSVQLPHAYKEGTDLHPHIHWSPINGNIGNVVWGIEYTPSAIDGTFGDTSTLEATIAADGTGKKHQVDELGTISGTGLGISSMLLFRLYRLANDAADTYDSDATLLEFDLHYEVDRPGSRSEYTK